MIAGKVAEPAPAFAARLAEHAGRIARARVLARVLERRGRGERRWRHARLLWPLFAGD